MVLLGIILLTAVGFWSVAAYRDYFSRMQKKHRDEQSDDLKFMQVLIPKNRMARSADMEATDHINSMKQNIELMNQVYKNLYAVYEESKLNEKYWNNFVSMEVVVEDQLIKFFLWIPSGHVETVEKSISSFYPWAVVHLVEQPKMLEEGKFLSWGELLLKKSNANPIKMYDVFEADPMDSLFASFARVQKKEKVALQVLLSPLHEKRQKELRKSVEDIKEDKKKSAWKDYVVYFFKKMLWTDSDDGDDKKKSHKFSNQQLWDLDKKVEDELFEVSIKLLAISPEEKRPDIMIQDMVRAFQQYNYVGLNGFTYTKAEDSKKFAIEFVKRTLGKNRSLLDSYKNFNTFMILNIKELSSFLHFPHSRFNRSPRIIWQKYKIIPAPDNTPSEGVYLGDNLFGWVKRKIYVKPTDRFRHFYIIWQTGTGKSTMMENMAVQDMRLWNGFCLIDPHGDLCDHILPYLPKERLDDLIYFDLSNVDYPIGFNPFDADTDEERDIVTNDMIEMFVGMYGQEIFGPRIQDYFINAAFLLMEQPDGGTLPEVMRLFTDEAYLEAKLKNLTNPVINAWWRKTYKAMGDREKKEIIPFLQSKFSSFTNGVYVRNVIGQPKSAFNFTDAMQEWKIILCNLSKWLTGEINSQLIGRMFAMQIKIHALRRAAIESKDRQPYFLYVDEFQNYVSQSFESILSEARKYKLGLCIAHQYIEQLKSAGLWGSVDMAKPIFGNVGSQLYLKVGPEDAEFLEKNVEPEFSKGDLISMDRFKWVMTLSIDTQPSRPFSIAPYYVLQEDPVHLSEKVEIIKQISALKWGTKRELAEKEIFYRVGV